ncbi:MAG: hypothetical protein V4543_11375 [Bacteroidota bacterium]
MDTLYYYLPVLLLCACSAFALSGKAFSRPAKVLQFFNMASLSCLTYGAVLGMYSMKFFIGALQGEHPAVYITRYASFILALLVMPLNFIYLVYLLSARKPKPNTKVMKSN